MNLVEKYNLNNDLLNSIEQDDYDYILTHEEKVIKIIEYLEEKGIKESYKLIYYRPFIFYNSLEEIKDKLERNLNLIEDINEDYVAFEIIDL